ncbi:MAG: hypothetical protein KHZ72_11435 [Lachnospiraceae bacterium]|nr:hypothetical protein [Lachnospiraceae bacterium]
MKIKIATSGRNATLDIENEQIAEAVFNRLVIMMFGIAKEYQEKKLIGKDHEHKRIKNQDTSQQEEKQEEKRYKGFLHLECPNCGTIKSFNSAKEIKGYHCFECGEDMIFEEELKPLYVNCECGNSYRYMTNIKEQIFDIDCLNCGSPVAVKWNEKKLVYETIRGE